MTCASGGWGVWESGSVTCADGRGLARGRRVAVQLALVAAAGGEQAGEWQRLELAACRWRGESSGRTCGGGQMGVGRRAVA